MKDKATLVKDLTEEVNDLEAKLDKLDRFMYSTDFRKLPDEDFRLLNAQQDAMCTYHFILKERLDRARGKSED